MTRNEIIKDCHEILNSLGKSNKVTINWIPGHKGYEGNEIADKLAKAGAMKETTTETYNKIPFNILVSHIKNHFNKTILNRYKSSGISSEAQIITNELLSKLENSTKKPFTHIIEYVNNKFINHCKSTVQSQLTKLSLNYNKTRIQ